MEREYFTSEEARSKVGRKINTLREFSGVPRGTTGTVIKMDESARQGYYTLAIQWDLPTERREFGGGVIGGEEFVCVSGGKPLVDWFTEGEYENYLQELKICGD